jgi:general secretion pathway protein K
MFKVQGLMPAKTGSRWIRAQKPGQQGIALIMVLWVITIMMVIVLSFSLSSRTETFATLVFKEDKERKFIAEAGVERAIMELFYHRMYRNQQVTLQGREVWKTDGTPYTVQVGDGACIIRITDESGKIDINTASDIILRTFFLSFELEQDIVDTIVDSIMDWRDADDLKRLHGAESEYYLSLPSPYRAKNADFESVEELLLVKGITPEILYGSPEKKGTIEFLTVVGKARQINIMTAPKEVLMAIPGIDQGKADEIITLRENVAMFPQIHALLPSQSAQYVTYGGFFSIFAIESVGYKERQKAGYSIKAAVILEGNNKYRYLFFKSPAGIKQ